MSYLQPEIGDCVIPAFPHGHLRSALSEYDFAIIVSLNPFVIVSENGDMLWREKMLFNLNDTPPNDDRFAQCYYVRAICKVHPCISKKAFERWNKEKK